MGTGEGGGGKEHRSAQKAYLEKDEGKEEGMRDIDWLVGRRMGTKALTGMLLGCVVEGKGSGGEDRGEARGRMSARKRTSTI
jgi:hypothetical protein